MIAALGTSRAALGGRYLRQSFLGLNLSDPRSQDYLRRAAMDCSILFLDTGGSMVDEEYGPPLKTGVRFLRTLMRENVLTVVLCVHMVKPVRDGKGGSVKRRPLSDVMGQWTRQADVVAVMTDLGADRYRWELVKRRGVPQLGRDHRLLVRARDVGRGCGCSGDVLEHRDEIRAFRSIAAGATSWEQLRDGLELSKDKVFAAIRALRRDGLIGPGTPYAITADGWEALS